MGQEPPAFPTPAYTEKPGQVHYNSHQSNQPMPSAQPYYPQQLHQYKNEYRPQQAHQGSYQQTQPQHHAQPQVIYVQQPQQSKPDNSDSCCLPCACCAGCFAAVFCCPCFCCC